MEHENGFTFFTVTQRTSSLESKSHPEQPCWKQMSNRFQLQPNWLKETAKHRLLRFACLSRRARATEPGGVRYQLLCELGSACNLQMSPRTQKTPSHQHENRMRADIPPSGPRGNARFPSHNTQLDRQHKTLDEGQKHQACAGLHQTGLNQYSSASKVLIMDQILMFPEGHMKITKRRILPGILNFITQNKSLCWGKSASDTNMKY